MIDGYLSLGQWVCFFAPVAISRLDLRSKKRRFQEEPREMRVGGTI